MINQEKYVEESKVWIIKKKILRKQKFEESRKKSWVNESLINQEKNLEESKVNIIKNKHA